MVGSDDHQIAAFFYVSTEEIQTDLAHIKGLLSEEMIALHIREREEIRAAAERSKRLREELSEDLLLPIDELFRRGIDPALVLRRYREAVNGDLIEIETLRSKDASPAIDKKADVHALEDDLQCISRLRNEDKKQTKSNEPTSKGLARLSAIDNKISQIDSKRRKQRRLSIRIDNNMIEKLQEHARKPHSDLSRLVRSAIEQYLESCNRAENSSI
jgi:HD superfamily phosphohydrolase